MSKSLCVVAWQTGTIFTLFIGYGDCKSRPDVCELTLETVMMVMVVVCSGDSEDGGKSGGEDGGDGENGGGRHGTEDGGDGGEDGVSNIVDHRTKATTLGNKTPRIRRNANEAPSTVDIARAVKRQKICDKIQGPRNQRKTRILARKLTLKVNEAVVKKAFGLYWNKMSLTWRGGSWWKGVKDGYLRSVLVGLSS